MRKDKTPEEIRAGWAANLGNKPTTNKPKPKKVHPLYQSNGLDWKKAVPAILLVVVLVGGGLLGWLATHGWKF